MAINREVIESPLSQGVDESISYQITTTPWGSSPSSIVCTVYDVTGGGYTSLVLTTIMPTNTPTALGDVITLSPLTALTNGTFYRVEVKFTCGGAVYETFFIVAAER